MIHKNYHRWYETIRFCGISTQLGRIKNRIVSKLHINIREKYKRRYYPKVWRKKILILERNRSQDRFLNLKNSNRGEPLIPFSNTDRNT